MRFLFIGVPLVELDGHVYDTLEEKDFEYVITNTLDLPDVTYRKLIFYYDNQYHKLFTIPKEKVLLGNAPAFLSHYQTFDVTKPLAEVIRDDIQRQLTHLSKITLLT
jgi:hypothetical protein